MAVSYKTWLASNGRKGTAADALIWKKTHGVALGIYNPDGTAKAKPTAAAPGPPAPPAPISLADMRLPGLQADLQAIPGRFNDQRRGDANDILRGLLSSGLLESGTLAEEKSASGIPGADGADQQNIVYKIIPGPGGKMYRQAYMSTVASQNARGFLESSQTNQRVQEGKAGLDANVNDALQALLKHSSQSLDDQRSATSSASGAITGVKQEAADKAQAAGPPPPTAATSVPLPTSTPAVGSSNTAARPAVRPAPPLHGAVIPSAPVRKRPMTKPQWVTWHQTLRKPPTGTYEQYVQTHS